jgi:hypothetical protein
MNIFWSLGPCDFYILSWQLAFGNIVEAHLAQSKSGTLHHARPTITMVRLNNQPYSWDGV